MLIEPLSSEDFSIFFLLCIIVVYGLEISAKSACIHLCDKSELHVVLNLYRLFFKMSM